MRCCYRLSIGLILVLGAADSPHPALPPLLARLNKKFLIQEIIFPNVVGKIDTKTCTGSHNQPKDQQLTCACNSLFHFILITLSNLEQKDQRAFEHDLFHFVRNYFFFK